MIAIIVIIRRFFGCQVSFPQRSAYSILRRDGPKISLCVSCNWQGTCSGVCASRSNCLCVAIRILESGARCLAGPRASRRGQATCTQTVQRVSKDTSSNQQAVRGDVPEMLQCIQGPARQENFAVTPARQKQDRAKENVQTVPQDPGTMGNKI